MSFAQRNLCPGCLQNQPNQLAHMNLGGCLYTQEDEEDKEDEDEENWETDSNASADSREEFVFIGTRWVLPTLSLPTLSSEAEAEAEAEANAEAEAEAEAVWLVRGSSEAGRGLASGWPEAIQRGGAGSVVCSRW